MTKLGAALSVGAALFVLAGCGSGTTSSSVVRSHNCFAAWNARGNERNRADLLRRGFTIGSVEGGVVIGDPAPAGSQHEGHLCGYLFHSAARFVSYTGDWRGDTLLWTNSEGLHGRWTPAQQRSQPDNVRVAEDGRIASR
jgi:hypothetical protein